MKTNLGKLDRVIRFLIAIRFLIVAVIVILYMYDIIYGALGTIFLVLANIFVLTRFVGFCPLYALFGLNTSSMKQKSNN